MNGIHLPDSDLGALLHTIYTSYCRARAHTHLILGSRAHDPIKDRLPFYPEEDPDHRSQVQKIDYLPIVSTTPHSYILEGLENVMIQITGKINQLLISNCVGLVINLEEGTVSGIITIRSHQIHMAQPRNRDLLATAHESQYVYVNEQQIPNDREC